MQRPQKLSIHHHWITLLRRLSSVLLMISACHAIQTKRKMQMPWSVGHSRLKTQRAEQCGEKRGGGEGELDSLQASKDLPRHPTSSKLLMNLIKMNYYHIIWRIIFILSLLSRRWKRYAYVIKNFAKADENDGSASRKASAKLPPANIIGHSCRFLHSSSIWIYQVHH